MPIADADVGVDRTQQADNVRNSVDGMELVLLERKLVRVGSYPVHDDANANVNANGAENESGAENEDEVDKRCVPHESPKRKREDGGTKVF